jgi:acetoacetyl-CoA reductase
MTPLLSNVCYLQIDFLNQCYKSCKSSRKTINDMLDTSHNLLNHFARQQHINLDSFLGSLQNNGKTKSETLKTKRLSVGTAVVTGGIGGIGTAICKRLCADGNQIVATYIATDKEKAFAWKKQLENDGYQVNISECDVADFDSCRKLADQIEKKYGRVEILINAAGITSDAMLKKMDTHKWHTVINTNLDSVFNVTRNFIKGMLDNGYGRIINIASVNGQKGQFGQTNYSTAKAGMIGFTRSLALELADKGITVNCVCPGYVGTPMVDAIRKDILDTIIKQIPVGRLATTEEIADAVAFLADSKSAYITGTELAVNGGLWMG